MGKGSSKGSSSGSTSSGRSSGRSGSSKSSSGSQSSSHGFGGTHWSDNSLNGDGNYAVGRNSDGETVIATRGGSDE